jgi:hypothetical protein
LNVTSGRNVATTGFDIFGGRVSGALLTIIVLFSLVAPVWARGAGRPVRVPTRPAYLLSS